MDMISNIGTDTNVDLIKECDCMKDFNLSQFLGCCVIGISIVVAGWLISKEMPNTTQVPSNLSVVTQAQDEQYGNYLSKYEVAAYLGITDEDVDQLFASGKLDGTYTVAGANYIFSREKLDEWVENRLK